MTKTYDGYVVCAEAGHEHVTTEAEMEIGVMDHLDLATHTVRILAPKGAVENNDEITECCIGCAGKLAEAWIGWGWDIEVRDTAR